MIEVIGRILPLAVVVALSPPPIMATVAILLGARGAPRGLALLAGRLGGVLVVVIVFTLFAEYLTAWGLPPAVDALVRLGLGVALAVVGIRKLATRSAAEPSTPGWMSSIGTMSGRRALGFGMLISVVNPKELAMGAAAGLVIGDAVDQPLPALSAVLVYAAIATLGVSLPLVAVVVAGEAAPPVLAQLQGWLERNSAATMGILLLVFGAILLGQALPALA